MLEVEGEDDRIDPRYAPIASQLIISMIRDERIQARARSDPADAQIDQGGYQAAALAFQQRLASGAARADLSAPATSHLPINDDDLDWE